MPERFGRRIPEATVARLPLYQRILTDLGGSRTVTVSSETLGDLAGVNAAKVRKDLSYLGSYGTRGAGYDAALLLAEIARALGTDREWPIGIVGVGHLGTALASSAGFSSNGFRVAALVDVDPATVGKTIAGVCVSHLDRLAETFARERIAIAVVTTPPAVAQAVVDRIVAAGVRSILNFAPAVLSVPDDVVLRQVDLSIQLQVLSFYQGRGDGGAGATRSRRAGGPAHIEGAGELARSDGGPGANLRPGGIGARPNAAPDGAGARPRPRSRTSR
jgi:redox-sensing transcriptional repressor